jgi:hypothetical protein
VENPIWALWVSVLGMSRQVANVAGAVGAILVCGESLGSDVTLSNIKMAHEKSNDREYPFY